MLAKTFNLKNESSTDIQTFMTNFGELSGNISENGSERAECYQNDRRRESKQLSMVNVSHDNK